MERVLMLVGATLMLVSLPSTVRAYRRERRGGAVSARSSYGVCPFFGILVLTSTSALDVHPTAKMVLAMIGCVLAFASLYFDKDMVVGFSVLPRNSQRAARAIVSFRTSTLTPSRFTNAAASSNLRRRMQRAASC
jgi:hypothetical protein